MGEIDNLADEARNSISDFCINECHAFCCRKGFLPLRPEQIELVTGTQKELLEKEGSIKEMINGKSFLKLNNSLGSCPQLKNNLCSIHKNEKRPNTCKEFPIFILGKKIKISSKCPAKNENKFFLFERQVKELGYELVKDFFE